MQKATINFNCIFFSHLHRLYLTSVLKRVKYLFKQHHNQYKIHRHFFSLAVSDDLYLTHTTATDIF